LKELSLIGYVVFHREHLPCADIASC